MMVCAFVCVRVRERERGAIIEVFASSRARGNTTHAKVGGSRAKGQRSSSGLF